MNDTKSMGFFDKIKQGLTKTKNNMSIKMNNMFAGFTGENEEFYDELEETMILADAVIELAASDRVIERLPVAING